eukprot:14988263-Alexandrium_andersonii.AAC.1
MPTQSQCANIHLHALKSLVGSVGSGIQGVGRVHPGLGGAASQLRVRLVTCQGRGLLCDAGSSRSHQHLQQRYVSATLC